MADQAAYPILPGSDLLMLTAWGAAYLLGGLMCLLLVVVAGVFVTSNNPVLSIGYFVYANTPLGQVIHNMQLSSFRSAALKAAENGRRQDALHSANSSVTILLPGTGDDPVEVTVVPIPVLSDNFQYLLFYRNPAKEGDNHFLAIAVDVADADMLALTLDGLRRGVGSGGSFTLTHIFTTHRHMDHCGGHAGLQQALADSCPGQPLPCIVAPLLDPTPGVTKPVRDGDVVQLFPAGDSTAGTVPTLQVAVRAAPGHTRGHVLYYMSVAGTSPGAHGQANTPATHLGGDGAPETVALSASGILFTGDTLFVGGVGRFFEGTPGAMVRNLYRSCGAGRSSSECPDELVGNAYPPDAIILTGHEYSVPNLEFGAWVAQGTAGESEVRAKATWAAEQRTKRLPTAISTLEGESQHNVFMHCHRADMLRRLAGLHVDLVRAAGRKSFIDAVGAHAVLQAVKDTPKAVFALPILAAAMGLLRALKDADAHLTGKQD